MAVTTAKAHGVTVWLCQEDLGAVTVWQATICTGTTASTARRARLLLKRISLILKTHKQPKKEMKAKDLIKALQCVGPDSIVTFTLGVNDYYREVAAKAELLGYNSLFNLLAMFADVQIRESGETIDITLRCVDEAEQTDVENEFNKMYKEIE